MLAPHRKIAGPFHNGLNRRRFLRTALASTASPRIVRPAPRPQLNLLLIIVDDLRPALGCYGHPFVHSPNIDRLARIGMTFQRAYCQLAICAPSRASLLTGCRPDTTRVYRNADRLAKLSPNLLTLPHLFREHGYVTISLSKVFHYPYDHPDAWTEPVWQPQGNWIGRGYLTEEAARIAKEHAKPTASEFTADLNDPRKGLRGPPFEAARVPDEAYPDGVTLREAIERLNRLRRQPFFMALGFLRPHLPFNAPKRYWQLYREEDIPLPDQNRWPTAAPEIALMNSEELRTYAGIPSRGPVHPRLARQLIRGYYACISYIDTLIGRLLSHLETLQLLNNTIVVLLGDHGYKLGDYGAWGKATNFEVDARAPLIFYVPKLSGAGTACPALVEFLDIFPTVAELCGIRMPAQCEGLSFRPLLANPTRPWKQAAFSQILRRQNIMGYSMRYHQYRYTEWIDLNSAQVVARELYDHSKTLLAAENLAYNSDYQPLVTSLSRLLDRGRGWRQIQQTVVEHNATTPSRQK